MIADGLVKEAQRFERAMEQVKVQVESYGADYDELFERAKKLATETTMSTEQAVYYLLEKTRKSLSE